MTAIPIGIELDGEGAHPAAWRVADHPPTRILQPAHITARVHSIDAAGFGFITLPERRSAAAHPNVEAGLDTIEVAVFAAASTSRIGLVPAANTIHAEPYHLANQLNTLDWASQGRAGWLAGAEYSHRISAAYGREAATVSSDTLGEARDVVAAVRRLWDTWEDDVLIADEEHDRFFDLDRWHYADFVGDRFRIKGPGLLPRPPQGQLVVWGESAAAELLPLIDVIVLSTASIETLAAVARGAAEAGVPRRVAAVEIAVDAGGVRASDRIAALDDWTPWPQGERLRITGSAAEVAEQLIAVSAEVDGIRLHPAVLDVDLPVVIDEILPRLDASGVLRRPEPRSTLRDLFALSRPANIFELARENR
ncbi:LLM class flavin-dependent oxidoreductase [Microbacterium saperdae]